MTWALIKQAINLFCFARKMNSIEQENRFFQREPSECRRSDSGIPDAICLIENLQMLPIDPLILKRLLKQLHLWGCFVNSNQVAHRDLASTNLWINPFTMCTTCPSLSDGVLCFYIWHTAFQKQVLPNGEGTCFTVLPEEPASAASVLPGYVKDELASNLISCDNCLNVVVHSSVLWDYWLQFTLSSFLTDIFVLLGSGWSSY